MRRVLTALAVAAATLLAVFPLYWAVVNSVRPRDVPLEALWLPGMTFTPTLAAWKQMLELPGLWTALVNSVVISAVASSLAVFLAAPAAYAISRVPFPPGWARDQNATRAHRQVHAACAPPARPPMNRSSGAVRPRFWGGYRGEAPSRRAPGLSQMDLGRPAPA